MVFVIALAALAAMQQPRAQAEPASRPSVIVPASSSPKTPRDSTVAGIVLIGNRVALVRSALGQLRRFAFNGPANQVGARASLLRQRCLDLTAAAREADRMMCRRCLAARNQAAVENYRAGLPGLGALGRRCATALQPVAGTTEASTTERTRRIVRAVGNQMVAGLGPYEARLQRVRVVFGWASSGVAEPARP